MCDDGPVRIVTIDRPDVRNAVDRRTASRLEDAFVAFDSDPDARVAVLTGSGGPSVPARTSARSQAARRIGWLWMVRDRWAHQAVAHKARDRRLEGCAVAGGFELALWCDLRVLAEDATLGVFCRRVGVPLVDGGTVRLPRLIGESRALDLILTGRAVDAAEALAIGLANRVVPSGTALEAAVVLARELAELRQVCMRNELRLVYELFGVPEVDAWPLECALGIESLAADRLRGARAFREGAGRHGQPLHFGSEAEADQASTTRTGAGCRSRVACRSSQDGPSLVTADRRRSP